MNYNCESAIVIAKTGNDDATVVITYVPYLTNNYSTTTFQVLPLDENATTSDIVVLGSFSAGEIVISFLLLSLILLKLASSLASALSNIKTKKTFLQYGGGDVEIRNDL